jgi:hypothetical protein
MATICKNVQDRVEKKVWEPVDDWVKSTEEKCEEYDWWNPIGWFCWLVTIVVKIVRWVLSTVVTFVFRLVCEVINFLLNLVAAIINIFLAIPLIGPIIKAFIKAVVTVISYVVGLVDGLAGLVGIRTTKNLRVHVIPLCEGNFPLAYESHLVPVMRETERILYDRARIRVHTTFHEPYRNPPEDALRLGTEFDLILDELWLKGSWHQMQTVKLFESNIWSVLGLGHPVIVYVIREVGYDGPAAVSAGGIAGTSGGPFTDWIAVERDIVVPTVVAGPGGMAAIPLTPFPTTVASSLAGTGIPNIFYQPRVIAHEICHALGLLGHENSNPGELMVPGGITGDALSPFQVGIIRSSGHVTFL